MTATELIALCESRINGLSRTRQAFEHTGAPEHVEGLIDDLRVAASDWDTAVSGPPEGDPVALRVGARTVRNGVPGFGVVADAIESYASALESGQARHTAGLARLAAAQRDVARLQQAGRTDPEQAETASRAAIAVLDAACAGYAACQDAYEAVRAAEGALYAALAHVRAGRPGYRSGLSV
jgi:hypothetical protein